MGPFHADLVLDGAGDAEREVELGSDGLPRAADLAVHGQPAAVTNGSRRADLGPQRFGQLPDQLEILRRLDAASYGDDDLSLGQVHGLPRLAKPLAGPSAYAVRSQGHLDHGDLGRRRAPADRVFAKRARLERYEVARFTRQFHIGVELALEDLANENQPLALFSIA